MKKRSSVMARRNSRAITAVVVSTFMLLGACASDEAGTNTERTSSDTSSQNPQVDAQPPADTGTVHETPAMSASPPVRLEIPSIGVDVAIIDLGLNPDETLEVPPDGTVAGWYTGAPTPGEVGPAIVTGHVDWAGDKGVFFDLRDLRPGANIIIDREDGSRVVFSAVAIEHFPKNAFPTQTVYGDIDHVGLRLITCGGSFDTGARSYTDNIIAFAELA